MVEEARQQFDGVESRMAENASAVCGLGFWSDAHHHTFAYEKGCSIRWLLALFVFSGNTAKVTTTFGAD